MLMFGEVQHARAAFVVRRIIGALACGACLISASCTEADEAPPPAEISLPGEVETLYPDAEPLPGQAECKVVIARKIEIGEVLHIDICTEIQYETNPPSGGDHWPKWAAYKEYTTPVPRPLYVHNQEHGGVVLSYKCEGECPEVVTTLQQVMNELPDDAICGTVPGVSKRLLLAPDPEITTPIAVSAWGAIYMATCIDKESLASFVSEVYGKGTEETCWNGVDISQTNGVPTECQD